MARLSQLLAGGLLLLLVARSAWGQNQEGAVVGKLRLATGQATSERLRVELQTNQGVPVSVQYTDSNGNFNFLNLGSGRYQVVLVSERFTAAVESVQIHADQPMVRVFLYANLLPSAAPSLPSGPTADPFSVSVKELKQIYPARGVKDYEAGLKKARSGDSGGAITAYQKALEVAPEFYLAHNNLGVLYMNSGRDKEAEEHFKQAIHLNEKPGQPYTNLGRIYFERGDLRQAREALDKAVQKNSHSAVAAFLAGSVYFRQGDSSAETLLRRAHQLDPTMARVHLQLANLYMKFGKQKEMIKELQDFLREHPDDPQAVVVKQRLTALQR